MHLLWTFLKDVPNVARWRRKDRPSSAFIEAGRGTLQVSDASGALQHGADVVAYFGEDGQLWVRSVAEFEGRFEMVKEEW